MAARGPSARDVDDEGGPPSHLGTWSSATVVGRDAEIARLAALLEEGGTIALVGEAGIGKTRLAREAVALARAAGRRVVEGGTGTAEGDRPLAPLRDAVRSHLRAGPVEPLDDPLAAAFPAMVLPELHEDLAGREPAPDVVFEAAARWLAGLAADGGLLLVLEDLHWADATTHRLVLHLARVAVGGRVAMVVTFRPHEAEPGSSLDELRRELTRERLGRELCLDPLDRAALTELLAGLVGATPEPPVVDRFLEAGGGNPFVTEEFLGAAIAAGRIVPGEGRWRGPLAVGLPWGVAEMVLSRVRRLPGPDRELLRLAAVAGEQFPFELVRAAGGVGEDERAGGARAGPGGRPRARRRRRRAGVPARPGPRGGARIHVGPRAPRPSPTPARRGAGARRRGRRRALRAAAEPRGRRRRARVGLPLRAAGRPALAGAGRGVGGAGSDRARPGALDAGRRRRAAGASSSSSRVDCCTGSPRSTRARPMRSRRRSARFATWATRRAPPSRGRCGRARAGGRAIRRRSRTSGPRPAASPPGPRSSCAWRCSTSSPVP